MKRIPMFPLLAVALAISAVMLALSPPAAQANGYDTYAAIAYSEATGRVGHASGHQSRRDAEGEAVRNCGTFDAKVVVWVRNGWCALALGDDLGLYGYGWDNDSRARAMERALFECRKRTSNSYVHVVLHSDG
jgi:hypothetical protein